MIQTGHCQMMKRFEPEMGLNKQYPTQTSTPLKFKYHFIEQTQVSDLMGRKEMKEESQKGTRFLGNKAVAILNKWFMENRDYPYPDETTTDQLAREAEISAKQVKKWFANKRVRSQLCCKPVHRNKRKCEKKFKNENNETVNYLKSESQIKSVRCVSSGSSSGESLYPSNQFANTFPAKFHFQPAQQSQLSPNTQFPLNSNNNNFAQVLPTIPQLNAANMNPMFLRSMFNPMLLMNLIQSGNLSAFSGLLSAANNSAHQRLSHSFQQQQQQPKQQEEKHEEEEIVNNWRVGKLSSSDEHSNDSISAELENNNDESAMYEFGHEANKMSREEEEEFEEDYEEEEEDEDYEESSKFKSSLTTNMFLPRMKRDNSSDEETQQRTLDSSRSESSVATKNNLVNNSHSGSSENSNSQLNAYSSSSPFSSSSRSSSSSSTPTNHLFPRSKTATSPHSSPTFLPNRPTTSTTTTEKKINFAVVSTLVD